MSSYDALFDSFKRSYTRKYPPPQKKQAAKNNWLMLVALTVVVIGSVVLSASHTIPLFIQGTNPFIGVATFAAFEMGLIALKFLVTREKLIYEPESGRSLKWIQFAIGVSVTVMVVSNLYAVAKSYGVQHVAADALLIIVLGVSAPLLIYVSGQALAIEAAKAAMIQTQMDNEYSAQIESYNAEMVRKWELYAKKAGVQIGQDDVTVERPLLTDVADTNGQTATQTVKRPNGQRPPTATNEQGRRGRDPQAVTRAVNHLKDNPDDAKLSDRALGDKLGVGRTSANLAKTAYWQTGGIEQ